MDLLESALTSLTLPDSLTSVGDYAFRGCSALARVTVPTTATIGEAAFSPATAVLPIEAELLGS